MHIFVDRSIASLTVALTRPATCTTSYRIAPTAMPVLESSQSDQGRARATSDQVPRAFSRQPRKTHTCRAHTSRACHAIRTALTAAAARTVLSRSSYYLMTNSTREPILMSSVPAELLAVFGDLTCATSIGVEGGWRATLVTALTTTLTSGSCMALRRLGGSLIMAEHQDGPNAPFLSYLLTSTKPA